MSTGQQHYLEKNQLSFASINAHIDRFDLAAFTAQDVVTTQSNRVERLLTVYGAVRPILSALSAIPLIPAAWSAVLRIFVVTADQATASFKAGKDLAVGPAGTVNQMEPKLPSA